MVMLMNLIVADTRCTGGDAGQAKSAFDGSRVPGVQAHPIAPVKLFKGNLRGIVQARRLVSDHHQHEAGPWLGLLVRRAGHSFGGRVAVPVHRLAVVGDDCSAGLAPEFSIRHHQCIASEGSKP